MTIVISGYANSSEQVYYFGPFTDETKAMAFFDRMLASGKWQDVGRYWLNRPELIGTGQETAFEWPDPYV